MFFNKSPKNKKQRNSKRKPVERELSKKQSAEKSQNYFVEAKNWADDYYASAITSRNRYKFAFILSLFAVITLALAIASMVPLQRTELAIVHQDGNGNTWVTMSKRYDQIDESWLRTKSEISRYVTYRNTYDPAIYDYYTKMVILYSSPSLAKAYIANQGSNQSYVKLYGIENTLSVQVLSILPLDFASKNTNGQKTHHNLAQVTYVETLTNQKSGDVVRKTYTAEVSWKYRGIPHDPFAQLHDWNGFEITNFIATPDNN